MKQQIMSTIGTAVRIRSTIALAIVFIAIGLTGCVATTLHSTTLAIKGVPRGELRPKAEAGDAIAQYKLGKSYCCMGPGFDTQTATYWYCKSARQGNSAAMYELGLVYLGDVSRTPAPGQKIRRVLLPKKSPAHAYFWLNKASSLEHADARKKLTILSRQINAKDLATARQYGTDWRNVDCEHKDVFRK